jgi:GTPase SAR1 family protein
LNDTTGHAFILVYSVTSRQSLEELKPIWEMILSIKGDLKDVPIILVGNKCDENENRELTQVRFPELQSVGISFDRIKFLSIPLPFQLCSYASLEASNVSIAYVIPCMNAFCVLFVQNLIE